ncbi:uncharacterized protein N7515_009385 [Penicillium bovifimosum]|uniref:Rho-GAP domain-containing protein n=1 Tax=Penicillium bovifimosum TaxID=126998 RepID=A0A9W9GKA5_9EURO|nr:uncharacterized protein N7515_009385 [Penicillium bovifimosum]KAJ5121424.1 hypothetical protein N7515_009385 [Penicillium bovifimosum]
MRRLKTVFRSSKSDNPASRSGGSRRHHSHEGDPVKPPSDTTSREVRDERELAAVASDNAGETRAKAQHAENTGDLSRSKNGTRRLKRMVNRFRGSSQQDEEPMTEPQPQEQQEAARRESTVGPLTSNPFELEAPASAPAPAVAQDPTPNPTTVKTVRFNELTETREASVQTSNSQQSSPTRDCHDRPQEIPEPALEAWEEWVRPGLMLYETEQRQHVPEVSDPFSDGKAVDNQSQQSLEAQQARPGPSGRAGHNRETSRGSEASQATLDSIAETDVDAITPAPLPPSQTGSVRSQSSRVSWTSTLDGQKATLAFNQMATQFGVPIIIPIEDAAVGTTAGATPATEEETGRRRFGFLGKVRKVRSNLAVDTAPPSPTPKLRRRKTFANLRHPNPMTSLEGRSIETLARLGGHAYLMHTDLAPCPAQLPACIVAMLNFLHKYGLETPGLFIHRGDVKAAIRLYDHYSEHVLTAEKEESRIDLTMRLVAMPTLSGGTDTAPVLSVAWTLKALLAGLPIGILGSVRLYQVLNAMYHHSIPNPMHPLRVPACIAEATPVTAARVQLMCLALIALVPEMQRDLICSVFGLLALMVKDPNLRDQQPGMELRELSDPVANPNFHDLARAFGPLLLGVRGRENRERKDAAAQVLQEVEEQRVAGLMLNNWHYVHRQLQYWTKCRYMVSKE